ncbi:MAG TPA: M15 family metallopeptidase [Actinomycetota bacterium]|nr:M15 family metallopeptidase [Actinomycetota bacterium]
MPPTGLSFRPRTRVRYGRILVVLAALGGLVAFVWLGPFRGDGSPAVDASPSAGGASDRPPMCAQADAPARLAAVGDWEHTLVDTRFTLPAAYVPPGLVSTTEAGFDGAFLVRDFVVPDLIALRRAAEAAGNPVEVIASYRSYDDQAELFQRQVDRFGEEVALQRTARPGHSEHQLGTTVDFKTRGEDDVSPYWEDTPAGAWMAGHAVQYGFVMSYPRGKDAVTCYAYEPWHFRYFGRGRAAKIAASGLTVREFLWREQRPATRATPSPSASP